MRIERGDSLGSDFARFGIRQAARPPRLDVEPRLFDFNHFSAARNAELLPPWLASPKKALAFGRHPLVVFR